MRDISLPQVKLFPETVLQSADCLVQHGRLLPHPLKHVAIGLSQAGPLIPGHADRTLAGCPVPLHIFIVSNANKF